jgi:MYXO-CTERM domain-containing protein
MFRQRVLARSLVLAAFFALAMGPAIALADIAGPEPRERERPQVEVEAIHAPPIEPPAEVAPEVAPEVKAEAAPELKAEVAPADAKKEDAKQEDAKKAGSCSMVDNDDRVIGLAGLVLLISGFALRRRRS